jgi:tetrahydromethanopterin S-methyltransferase subunit G
MIKKIKTSVPIDDYNKIRIELEEEKKRTDFITKENFKLKKEI